MATALLTHPDCIRHEMGSGHPESPERLRAILAALEGSGLASSLALLEAPEATREQLERVHDASHVDMVFEAAPQSGYAYLDPDTSMNASSLSAALRAAGAVVKATDLVMSGEVRSAFCAVRPPGHHATRDRPMGFCLFNNVAIGAMHAIEAHGLARVAILDFDVHHGNGTEDIIANDERIFMVSIFQDKLYPFSGGVPLGDNMINVPVPAYTKGDEIRGIVEQQWLPALERFKPEMIFISAGFDAHRDDGMAFLRLLEPDYAWVTALVRQVAAKHACGRIVSLLEGGYDLDALGNSAAAHVRVLMSV